MADLNFAEKRKLERALEMGDGYVLDFSNRTFEAFIHDSVGIEIYDNKYDLASGSKANRMRAFWDLESNYIVGKLLDDLFSNWDEFTNTKWNPKTLQYEKKPLPKECLPIIQRLKSDSIVPEIEALIPNDDDKDFDALAKSVREYIKRNEPEVGLDRLHTFLMKYFRALFKKHNIEIEKQRPLHSLVGQYVKTLREKNAIESEMTERILKSSISVMEAFNKVRNDQSYAHDNKVLNYNEALLIFNHVSSSIRFIESLEKEKKNCKPTDEIPF